MNKKIPAMTTMKIFKTLQTATSQTLKKMARHLAARKMLQR